MRGKTRFESVRRDIKRPRPRSQFFRLISIRKLIRWYCLSYIIYTSLRIVVRIEDRSFAYIRFNVLYIYKKKTQKSLHKSMDHQQSLWKKNLHCWECEIHYYYLLNECYSLMFVSKNSLRFLTAYNFCICPSSWIPNTPNQNPNPFMSCTSRFFSLSPNISNLELHFKFFTDSMRLILVTFYPFCISMDYVDRNQLMF